MRRKNISCFLSATIGLIALIAPGSVRASPGDLYVSDAGSSNIYKFSATGVQSTFVSGLNRPFGLAFDRSGDLYETDLGSGTIFKFTPARTKTIFASGLDHPTALAFDSKDNLFVSVLSGVTNAVIFKFTPAGVKSTFALIPGIVLSLAFDRQGNLFAGGGDVGGILKFTPAGVKTKFASLTNSPFGLAFDRNGNLFAEDRGTGSIVKFTPAGTQSTFASGLTSPFGLAFDGKGNLFQTDPDLNGIFKFTPAGAQSAFASGLNGPSSLAFEPVKEELLNISARGLVQSGENVLIGGFIVGGNALVTNTVVVRAIGPSLGHFGISNPLKDPVLELRNSRGVLIASNNNWKDTQQAQIQTSGLAPTDVRESAILTTLPAGAYTAIVRGFGNTAGVALVEIYDVH